MNIRRTFLNVLLCSTAAFGAYYGVNWLAATGALHPPRFRRLGVGVRVEGKALHFDKAAWSLLLVTSPSCGVCLEDKAIHRRIVAAAADKGMPVYIALPRGASATYMDLPEACQHIEIAWGDLHTIAQGAPTIAVVDNEGVARRIWSGRLTESGMSNVLEAIAKRAPYRALRLGK